MAVKMKCADSVISKKYALYQGDCCEVVRGIPDESIGFSIFSPPFAELFSYSNSERDMGNSKNYDEFFIHFEYLIKHLYRVTQPGRIVAIHCIDIPAMKERDGFIGLKDFPGDIIKHFVNCGFTCHSRITIWKDPLTEVTRTKAIGLQHKQLLKDSAMCRAGLPDYLVSFKKPGVNANPISRKDGLTEYHGSKKIEGIGIKRCHNIWRAYASPVWMDIRQTNTLNKVKDENDQKHICPLQLDVIERAMELWSNKGDTVFTPFGGIGSEAYVAIKNGRKAVLIELKKAYFKQAVKNIRSLRNRSHAKRLIG